MSLRKTENKYEAVIKSQLIIVGSLFLILSGIGMISYKYYHNQQLDKQEQQQIDEFINDQKKVVLGEDIEVESSVDESLDNSDSKETIKTSNEDYIAVLEIPKINLRKGLYSKDSSNNNVNKNIEILDESDMPDNNNGNFILAGHSGSGRIAYFKDLHKLSNGDIAFVYYNGSRFGYTLINRYEIDKTGTAQITRNGQNDALTLITCKHNTNKQIVFIFERMKDGENNE